MPDFDKLQEDVNALDELLKNRQEGRTSWCIMVGRRWQSIAEAWSGPTNDANTQEGGYLIPQKIKRAKKGLIAWLWRLFKNERGFEYVNLQEEFIAKAHQIKIVR
jgi:hypothetical protein